MDHSDNGNLKQLLQAARDGSDAALGKLLDGCRGYLLLIANSWLDENLQAKVGASDVVQETLIEAQYAFPQFCGTCEEELLAWLRKVLLNNLSDVRRRYLQTDKRQVSREQRLESSGSSCQFEHLLPTVSTSPSKRAAKAETAEKLGRILQELPEHYRHVLELRHFEELEFREIGRRMSRSEDAARMLWWRAFEKLAEELERSDVSP